MRQVGHALDLVGPFGHRLHHAHHVPPQQGFREGEAPVLLPGGDQEGRRRFHGVVEHAHGIAQPWRHMHIQHAQFPRGQGIAIGHGHRHPFLQGENVLELGVIHQDVHERQFCGARIANNVFHTCGMQDF